MPRADRFRILLLSVSALLLMAASVAAAPLDSLLDAAPDPVRLRASLMTFAERANPPSADGARAWRLAGISFDRAGRLDSAIVCFEQAARLGDDAGRAAWGEALLVRDMPGDAARAESLFVVRLDHARRSGGDEAELRGWIAWSQHVAGRTDSARAAFAAIASDLIQDERPTRWIWRYRLTAVHAPVDREKAVEYGLPLVVRSRAMDEELFTTIRGSMGGSQKDPLGMMARTEILASDREDQADCDRLKAKRIVFLSDDGFPLSAVVFPRAGSAKSRAVVALADPDGGWQDYDHLATGLREAGYATIVLEPRGNGRSVAPNCPSPESWRGREDELDQRVARDLRIALRALARETPVDTTRYLVIAGLDRSQEAAAAAQLDRSVHLLMLASPTPPEVERGRMRARLKSLALPVYIQAVAMDPDALPSSDRLFQAVDGRVSRLVESRLPGSYVQVFRLDTTALPRLTTWLTEHWNRAQATKPATKKSAPRPAAPRKG